MRLKIIGGPRDGDWISCCLNDPCECTTVGHGAPNGNKIMDGYVEFLMYRRESGGWVPDRIERRTMILTGNCPRCNRPMPKGTVNCKNCGAEMDPLATEMEGWAS